MLDEAEEGDKELRTKLLNLIEKGRARIAERQSAKETEVKKKGRRSVPDGSMTSLRQKASKTHPRPETDEDVFFTRPPTCLYKGCGVDLGGYPLFF